ncbi:50S ribosomal protein L19e [Candidatus Woesearchaeota archaeon]|nr:50S ribosomal protein L19e [Candidatus Woesearchaeota archaeon]
MKLDNQKKTAAKILKVSPKRVKVDPSRAEDLKEAITKTDLRGLIGDGAITKVQKKGVSRARANKGKAQRGKGLRKGAGSKKGKKTAHAPKKESWMRRIRAQRDFLKELKTKGRIDTRTFTGLYRKAKGGFFRSKKHIKIYIDEHRLTKKE